MTKPPDSQRPSKPSRGAQREKRDEPGGEKSLRLIGGRLGGRKIPYSGDERTRPMKDRVREAVFNLLTDDVIGKRAIDLFAGSGALAFEAISRGAASATIIERHFPTADLIKRAIKELDVAALCQVVPGDVFLWAKRFEPPDATPWVVFCSPPYDFYVERADAMQELIGSLMARAPAGSLFAVETDDRFDVAQLPQADEWDVRRYPPAVVCIFRKREDSE